MALQGEKSRDRPAEEAKPAFVVDDGDRQGTPYSNDSSDVSKPRLSVRTLLAVLAVCLIYFAQLVSLVGAGAVGFTATCPRMSAC